MSNQGTYSKWGPFLSVPNALMFGFPDVPDSGILLLSAMLGLEDHGRKLNAGLGYIQSITRAPSQGYARLILSILKGYRKVGPQAARSLTDKFYYQSEFTDLIELDEVNKQTYLDLATKCIGAIRVYDPESVYICDSPEPDTFELTANFYNKLRESVDLQNKLRNAANARRRGRG